MLNTQSEKLIYPEAPRLDRGKSAVRKAFCLGFVPRISTSFADLFELDRCESLRSLPYRYSYFPCIVAEPMALRNLTQGGTSTYFVHRNLFMAILGNQSSDPGGPPIPEIIGNSPAMQEVYRITRRVAGSNASVLILGETGVGKELIADAIHRLSHRSGGPFVRVNCGALSESLLESELFGHVRGAFTGAVANRTGRFEAAHGGTVFLDEINSTSLTLQVKLLRVLQEKEFERVGDTGTLSTDARIVAASNRDLMNEVREERFREDLYWRLNVVPIEIPPLRHRREDIPALISFFLEHYNEVNDRYVVHMGKGVIEAMQSYHWPGNVRELQNYIERAVVMSETDELSLENLPRCMVDSSVQADLPQHGSPNDFGTMAKQVVQLGLGQTAGDEVHASIVDQIEKEVIRQVLQECNGVQTKAATRLGINRNTLHKKIKDYGLAESE